MQVILFYILNQFRQLANSGRFVGEIQNSFRILIVDDDPDILSLLSGYLSEKYQVDSVLNGAEALQKLEKWTYDLVISDINMPGIKGYELLKQIREQYPSTKTALITAWSLEDYIENILENNIGNIISKTVPFNFEELETTIEKLLTKNIFGIQRYMEPETPITRKLVRRVEDIPTVRQQLIDEVADESFDQNYRMTLRLMLDESISNAAYHAHGLPKGSDFEFSDESAVVVVYGKDSEKIGISVSDPKGKLSQGDILSYLADCFNPTEETLLREGGRGLFLMHSMVDRLIINIERGVRTEVIMIIYTTKQESGSHPLLIHEI